MTRWALALPLAIVLAGCGGGAGPAAPVPATTLPPPTTTLPAATLADLSATLTSPEAGRKINCRREVNVVITVTNRAQSPISVSGIRKTGRTTSAGCFPSDDFTYRPIARTVGPGETVTVLERPLFNQGSGCCTDPGDCGGVCSFEETFTVLTSAGEVPAGWLGFRVEFGPNCERCSDSVAEAGAGAGGPGHP